MKRLWRWFLARFRLDLKVVCEESAGRGPYNGFHDYPDCAHGQPWHFVPMTCKRCGQEFYI